MPWVRATLRGQSVLARATESGELSVISGKVEIRYKPKDGRRYDALAKNLEQVSGELLPDETCAEAEAKPSSKDNGAKKPKAAAAVQRRATLEGAVIAYTDGACTGNPGPAGLGVVIVAGSDGRELSEYLGQGTNNIAELTAIERALTMVPSGPLAVHTDSQYAIGVLSKGWKAKANVELVARIRALLVGRQVELVYVPGHSGVPLNERADELAREAIKTRKTIERARSLGETKPSEQV